MVIYIQQDNAKPHTNPKDVTLQQEGKKDGWDIQLVAQPPNSPDFKVLDLGFLKSVMSLQQEISATNTDELIRSVEEAFWSESVETTNSIFLSLMKAMEGAMSVDGGNNYKLAHMAKSKLLRSRQLPISVTCSEEALEAAYEVLKAVP